MSRSKPDEILNNVFITFVLSFALFFLFGPLLQVFGNPEDIEYSRTFFPINAGDAVKVLGSNLIGFGISMMVGRAANYELFIRTIAGSFRKLPTFDFQHVVGVLVVAGLLARFYLVFNDIYVGGTMSAIYRNLPVLLPIGVFLHFKDHSLNFDAKTLLFLLAILCYSAVGVIEFNKSEILIPILALVCGILIRKMTLVRLAIAIIGMGVATALLQPIIGDGRIESLRESNISVIDRIGIFRSAYRGEFQIDRLVKISIWPRLDYTPPGAAAMWLYDNANGGDSYKLIPMLLVPRFLYPEKPIITSTGARFTEKISGFNSSATGQGVFISGYYDMGWFGLICASVLIGFILSWYRAVIVAAQVSNSLILLIVGLMGHLTAFAVSTDYLSTYLGGVVMPVYIIGFLHVMLLCTSSLSARVDK